MAGPKLFRLNIEVGALEAAVSFYSELLGLEGRSQMGSRCYFDAGGVTLQVVEVHAPHPAPRRFISRSPISMRSTPALWPSAACQAKTSTGRRPASQWCGPGASAASMSKIRGGIRSAL